MNFNFPVLIGATLIASPLGLAAVKVEVAQSQSDKGFKLDLIASPATNDAATLAIFTLVDGQRDGSGGDLAVLHDGKVPSEADEPARNFFFQNGSNGGRIGVDLGKPISIKAIHTYSWHPRARGPQVYKLYAANGTEKDFNGAPKRDTDPRSCGWKPIAKVDTRKKSPGGQHAASISDSRASSLGEFRYLLFDFESANPEDPQANTFLSEIDVIDANGPALEATKILEKIVRTYPSSDKKYTYIVDATAAPDLIKWVESDLIPMVKVWYPRMAAMLPSDGYEAPSTFQLSFKEDMPPGIPAYAQGNQLSISIPFCRSQLHGEAKGCVIHEMVHVIQNYWIAGKINKRPTQTPTWVGEAIADYIRWFLYEPEVKGAEITHGNFANAKYDSSYRISANFLNWVVENRDKNFIQKINAAAREGRYTEKVWNDATGKSLEELGAEWKATNAKRLGI